MDEFKQIASDDNIAKVIKAAFDADLDVAGGWGYTPSEASIIKKSADVKPLEHTLAAMRAHIEMSMTLSEDERYGSINLNELQREEQNIEGETYDVVEYEISAMNEKVYAEFINEYKTMYGKSGFDMAKHFDERAKKTLKRKVKHFFKSI